MVHHRGRHAAQQRLAEARQAVRSDHDHRGLVVLRRRQQGAPDLPLLPDRQRLGVESGGASQPRSLLGDPLGRPSIELVQLLGSLAQRARQHVGVRAQHGV
jgi:hypothetical protein